MHLVDREGSVNGIATRRRRPRLWDRAGIDDDRCGLWPQLRCKCDGIRLERENLALRPSDFELVFVADPRCGREDLPEAISTDPHHMAPAIPGIEVADDADALCIGRQDRERDARHAIAFDGMRTQLVVKSKLVSLRQ